MKCPYVGLTHAVPMWALGPWKRLFCSRNIHCFDECWDGRDHTLVCDACEALVFIDRIEP